MTELTVRVRRIYDEPEPDDGTRVLVDRVWPRGLRKDTAPMDTWFTDTAPSTELRRWFGHDPAKFAEFARRYRAELDPDAVQRLRDTADGPTLTLLTATKDLAHSHVTVLAAVLRGEGSPNPPRGN